MERYANPPSLLSLDRLGVRIRDPGRWITSERGSFSVIATAFRRSSADIEAQVGGTPFLPTVSGNRQYIIEGRGLLIRDLSDPMNPVNPGKFVEQADRFPKLIKAQDIQIAGNPAIVNSADGLLLIDVTDPSAPVELGCHPDIPGAGGMAVSLGLAYLPTLIGLRIVNILNPAKPVIPGSLDVGEIHEVHLQGDRFCVLKQNGDLLIIDASDPADPVPVGSFASRGTGRVRRFAIREAGRGGAASGPGIARIGVAGPGARRHDRGGR